jgi:hypothetical protein
VNFFVVFFSTSRQIPGHTTTASFHVFSQFLIHLSPCHSTLHSLSYRQRVVKHTKNTIHAKFRESNLNQAEYVFLQFIIHTTIRRHDAAESRQINHKFIFLCAECVCNFSHKNHHKIQSYVHKTSHAPLAITCLYLLSRRCR